VLRFSYNNQVPAPTVKGNFILMPKKEVSMDEQKLNKYYQGLVVNNYDTFLQELNAKTSVKVDRVYFVMMSEDHLLILSQEPNSEIELVSLYKPENDAVLNMVKEVLDIDNDGGRALFGTSDNNFNFLAPKSILRVLFSAKLLEGNGEELYHNFKGKDKKGKVREFSAPHPEFKKELRNLNTVLQYIFDRINKNFQVAYKKGKSISDNSTIHKDNKYIYNVDLKDFYPSCKRELVQEYIEFFFKNSFNGDVVMNKFLDVILKEDALFIGSPISGTLANLIISKPARYMKNITKNFGMDFSVYADDITFSSDRYISKELVENVFQVAFAKYELDQYFNLNKKKFHGMSNNRRRITGVTINHLNEETVNRKYYRELRTKIHKLSVGETNNINLQKLKGKFAFALMVDRSGKILRLINKFEDTIKVYKIVSEEKLKEIRGE
jgi:hypothetical protein